MHNFSSLSNKFLFNTYNDITLDDITFLCNKILCNIISIILNIKTHKSSRVPVLNSLGTSLYFEYSSTTISNLFIIIITLIIVLFKSVRNGKRHNKEN